MGSFVLSDSGRGSGVRIIAVANQKGGVAKTTTVISLAACLAASKKPCLVVDIDPQCNATSGLGLRPSTDPSLLELLLGESNHPKIVPHEAVPDLYVLTGCPDLVGAEKLFSNSPDPLLKLRNLVGSILEGERTFEYVLLDCPPSLNLLTLNALACATDLLVPVQAEFYALEGLTDILDSYEAAKEHANPDLKLLGLLLTMIDYRTNLSTEVESELRKHYGERVFKTTIPRNVRLSEAPSHGLPIILYDIWSRGAKAYMELTKEILKHDA